MVKWVVELGEYEVEFESRAAIKTQALVDFLQETTRMLDVRVWRGLVDGSLTKEGGGVGIHIITPKGEGLSFVVKFGCLLSNN